MNSSSEMDMSSQSNSRRSIKYFEQLKSEALIPAEVYERIAWRNAARLLDVDPERATD